MFGRRNMSVSYLIHPDPANVTVPSEKDSRPFDSILPTSCLFNLRVNLSVDAAFRITASPNIFFARS